MSLLKQRVFAIASVIAVAALVLATSTAPADAAVYYEYEANFWNELVFNTLYGDAFIHFWFH